MRSRKALGVRAASRGRPRPPAGSPRGGGGAPAAPPGGRRAGRSGPVAPAAGPGGGGSRAGPAPQQLHLAAEEGRHEGRHAGDPQAGAAGQERIGPLRARVEVDLAARALEPQRLDVDAPQGRAPDLVEEPGALVVRRRVVARLEHEAQAVELQLEELPARQPVGPHPGEQGAVEGQGRGGRGGGRRVQAVAAAGRPGGPRGRGRGAGRRGVRGSAHETADARQPGALAGEGLGDARAHRLGQRPQEPGVRRGAVEDEHPGGVAAHVRRGRGRRPEETGNPRGDLAVAPARRPAGQ